MSFNQHNSQQFSFEKYQKSTDLCSEAERTDYNYKEELEEYMDAINLYRSQIFIAENLPQDTLKQHNISIFNNEQLVLMRKDMTLKKTDCLFSVVKTYFYGLQYIYEILIGPFLMRILVLNLNRDSDDGDEDIDKEQIGAGGFGSVRAVRIKDQQFAIKRIPFKYKLESTSGYDFQAESNEQYQLRRCLREFCMFKICSLLEIGPRVIRSSYDLICFNNCIEFRMELCEPIASNQFYANHKELTLAQIRSELMGKLAKLHSLNIVHRDIKPENLLYSSSRKIFLFGDFGMNILLTQNSNQRTFTNFAGTAEYCGFQMRQLLSGQIGKVNLYLNDYCSLKTTLGCLEGHIAKESSEISMNNMSYRQESYDDLSDFQNFSANGESNATSRTQTETSYPATGQSLANFTTATTEAPKKLATSINHHESQIIYFISRKMQRNEVFDYKKILACVDRQLDRSESQDLFQNVSIELTSIFFGYKNSTNFSHQLKQWKNISRHYGPSSQHAIQILQKILQKISEQPSLGTNVESDVMQIKQQVIARSKMAISCESEMKIYRILGHNNNYTYSFIDFLRYQLQNKDKYGAKGQEKLTKRVIFILKQYLYCIKSKEHSIYQIKLINRLMLAIVNDPLIQSEQRITSDRIPDFSYVFLKSKQQLSYEDLGCYILYKIDFTRFDNAEIVDLIQQLKCYYNNSKQDGKLNIIISSIALKFMQFDPSYTQTAFNITKFTLSKYQQYSPETMMLKLQLMIYFNTLKKFPQVRILGDQVSLLLDKLQGKILNWDYYNIIKLKVIGESYIYDDLQQSESRLKDALQELIRCYGLTKYVNITYQIFSNLIYIYFALKKFTLSQRHLRDLRKILEETNQVDNIKRALNVYQLLIYVFMELGLKTLSDEEECAEITTLIINQIAQYVPFDAVSHPSQIIGAFRNGSNTKVIHFIEKQIFKTISKESLRFTFTSLYIQLSLSIAEYLFKEMKQFHECLKYLWKYIELKEMTPSLLSQYDYQVYNMFAMILMGCNSYRRAIIFLKRYIFKIPKNYFNAKKKAFEIMYKASARMNEKMAKIYYELTKNSSGLLFSKDYSVILNKEKSIHKKRLLKKWLEKV